MKTQTAYKKMRAWFTRPGAELAQDPLTGSCKYRVGMKARSKQRCAIGCLIKNKDYNSAWEGQSLTGVGKGRLPDYLKRVDFEFLHRAQVEHDGARTPAEFVRELDKLAKTFGLDVITDGDVKAAA